MNKNYLNLKRYKPNYGALSHADKIETNTNDATAVPARIETKTSDATAMPARFANLPPELTHKVFEFLSGKDVVPLLATSKKCRQSVLLRHGLFRQMIDRELSESKHQKHLKKYQKHFKKYREDIDSNKEMMFILAAALYIPLVLTPILGGPLFLRPFVYLFTEDDLFKDDHFEFDISIAMEFGFMFGAWWLFSNIILLGFVVNHLNINRKFEPYQQEFHFLENMRQVLLASEESTGSPESASTPTANESERISTPVRPYR